MTLSGWCAGPAGSRPPHEQCRATNCTCPCHTPEPQPEEAA